MTSCCAHCCRTGAIGRFWQCKAALLSHGGGLSGFCQARAHWHGNSACDAASDLDAEMRHLVAVLSRA